jgi:acylphosphatase
MPRPLSRPPSIQKPPRPPPINLTRRYLVLGKVQGVYFRHSTRAQAERLKLRGFVRNLEDGSVEVIAQGAPSALDDLQLWLQRGPDLARVDMVRELPPEDKSSLELPAGFDVR